MFKGVKLLNFPIGVVVLLRSGVLENLGTFCLAGSCLRSSTSFRLFGRGSFSASKASLAFMCF